ncbi:MAG TPA: putative DNA modification/repair radical SAM protein [Dehalococcoidia bacterium]|jgi:putative DNA modification/repair radical SAM protein|nr:putative DNA modification/repair radical SAM protein [Dehalococcoidia bacterium]
MEVEEKLATLVAAAQFDVCGYGGPRALGPSPLRFIHRAALPGGGSVCLFKVLLTNVCTSDCAYCVNQVGRDIPRASFPPEELAKVFMQLHSRRLVQGLFLSSGLGVNASATMERMIKTVELLRRRYEFKGYIHLKILPGASFDLVEAACRLADRVSVNMEAPTAQHLARLSTKKDLAQGILEPMRWVKKLVRANEKLVPAGQTTQFVVGAAHETDRDILRTTQALYREIELRRVYFSAFRPISNSPLEGLPPASPLRAHRLYQADWLLRVYGFSPQEVELALGERGDLPLRKDPKLVIAEKQPWLFPVDVNRASYEELLRVPGIGPVSAGRILETRREHRIFSMAQLGKMGVATGRAARFVWFQGMLDFEKQMSFLPQLDGIAPPSPLLAGVLGR